MSSGFTFGSTPSFGAPSGTGQFGFGSNPQQPSGFSFNSSLTNPTSSINPQTSGFTFGSTTSAPTTSLGFGMPLATSAPSATTSGLTFGSTPNFSLATSVPNPASGLSFAPPASSTTGFGFGSSQGMIPTLGAPKATTAATGFSLSALPTSTPTVMGFGNTAPTSSLNASQAGLPLGGIITAVSSTGLQLPGSTAAPSFNLNASTIVPSTGMTFASTTKAPALNFGVASSIAPTTGCLNFGTSLGVVPASSTAPPPKIGLGGIPTSAASTSGAATSKEIPPKEQQVPNEIQQDIEHFKNYIKQQKLYSSDVSRCSVKDFRCVETQIGLLNNVIKEIETQVQRNRSFAEKLKYDTAQGLQLLEMAQRTQDTPAGLQYDNVAPMNYFLSLADNFEKEMHSLKIQIENTDEYIKNFGHTETLTSQDLSLGMKRLHDTFVALAGRLQSVHTQVESQKELYIDLRKQLVNDFINPFEALDKQHNFTTSVLVQHRPPKIACGPTPFNQIMTSNLPITNQQNIPLPYTGLPSSFGMSSTVPGMFGNASLLNKTTTGFQAAPLGSNFQLQKPPTGNKRGKQ